MLKRVFHIVFITLLALNLSGAAVFASAFDCAMECCQPSAWTGSAVYEAPSCCDQDGVTCGFETGRFEGLLVKVFVRSSASTHSNHLTPYVPLSVTASGAKPLPDQALPYLSDGSPPTSPIFISNAVILC